jgi:hypothetical protein
MNPTTLQSTRSSVSGGYQPRGSNLHVVNLQSKVNMYDWYKSILRLDNNAGLLHQPVSLPPRITHQLPIHELLL